MIWTKRVLLTFPFIIAAALTILINGDDRQHAERNAGYGFLFGAPWDWLLDRGWFGHVHSRWLQTIIGYAVILWIPALLYSGCLWALFRLFTFLRLSRSR